MVIGSATAASANHTVEIGDTATVETKGLVLVVPVEVTCDPVVPPPFPLPLPPPFGSSVSVQVSQRSGNRIAQGFGSASVVCDSLPHTYELRLMAQQAPFKSGTALATASIFTCDSIGCHEASDTEEIRLRK